MTKKNQENKKVYTVGFVCRKCKHRWQSEQDHSKLPQLEDFPNFCPECGAKKEDGNIELDDSQFPTAVMDTRAEKKRKANLQYSREVRQQAARIRAEQPPEEMVTVERPSGETSRYGNTTEKVPKKVVEKLEESGKNFIEKNL